MTLLAHGYCLKDSFWIRPTENTKLFVEKGKMTIEIGKIKIYIVSHSDSRETDHYVSTNYLQYSIRVMYGNEELMTDRYVTEFELFEMRGKYYVSTRFTHSNTSQIGQGYKTKVRVHGFTKDGFYREEPKHECNCTKGEELGLNGCTTCILAKVEEAAKQLA